MYSWVSLQHFAVNLTGGQPKLNVLMLMLYWSEQMIRNCMYLPPKTRPTHTVKNWFTLTTVSRFRVDPPSNLWRHMKPKNTLTWAGHFLRNYNYWGKVSMTAFSPTQLRVHKDRPCCADFYKMDGMSKMWVAMRKQAYVAFSTRSRNIFFLLVIKRV
jgi:hypothetical protein